MKLTQREFCIAAVAGLFGFFLCYFLFGSTLPTPSPAPKWTVISPLPKPTPTNQPSFQLPSGIQRTNGQIVPMFGFGFRDRPELLGHQTPSLKLDLMSSRYRAEVNLSDLQ